MIRPVGRISLLIALAVTLCSQAARAQEPPGFQNYDDLDLIGGLEDPRYYGTGYFLDTEYGQYTHRLADEHVDVGLNVLDTKAGLFNKLSRRAYEFRASGVIPCKHGEIPIALYDEWVGELQLGVVASYNRADYHMRSNVEVVQGVNAFQIDDLNTHIWGFGPDARFLFPPTRRGLRLFVGARFEGLGGWANPDPTFLGAPNPMNQMVTAKPTADLGKIDEVWGLRGECSAGLVLWDSVTVSGSFGYTKLRTKVIDDLENNNDFTYWAIEVGIPTEVICNCACRVYSKLKK